MLTPSHRQLANAIRALSMDAVQKAKSGHPGCPMGMADIAEVLWNDYLQHNPKDPHWLNRDRFILSNGHGSMLLYSLLHLTGYNLSIDDLQAFRQLHSKTPGHPEFGYTPGVETTTGPLGQGLGHAVGMALAERITANTFNREGFSLIDHYTYAFCGDGCLMEGISHEVCSLAGTLGLGKLIVFYDDNGISIDGEVREWFTDNTALRFQSYGWQVIEQVDGHDAAQIKKAIDAARSDLSRPTLIMCKTIIGFGSPNKAGHESSHGSPLGEEEIALARKELDWPYAPFVIPEDYKKAWDAQEKGQELQAQWNELYTAYQAQYPELSAEFERRFSKLLPESFKETVHELMTTAQEAMQNIATRKASENVLNGLIKILPELLGGSADLTGSNLTITKQAEIVKKDHLKGNYLYYGVREFGMFTILNGVALYGGLIPYGGTFLMFADYGRNAIRLSALMKQRCIYVFSHDSIGLGEDGPTHQPIEHLTMLRATPNLFNWRPCDEVETIAAWSDALSRRAPSALMLTRQAVPAQKRDQAQLENISRGAYILYESRDMLTEIILIGTGSELSLCMDAAKELEAKQIGVRVVSMPCMEVFALQDKAYQDSVLSPSVTKRIAVEAGATLCWYRYVGTEGKVIGIDHYGESAPYQDLYKAFGLEVANIVQAAEKIIKV